MKEWKIKQEIFHKLNRIHADDLQNFSIEINDSVVDTAVKYFTDSKMGWIYPAKSYVVGICYAKWISEDFGEDFYSVLDDPELLWSNDPYFVPYSEDKETYDNILSAIQNIDVTAGIVSDIRKYYEEEIKWN